MLAIYLHGLFEHEAAVQALFGSGPAQSLDRTFDELADAVDAHLDMDSVASRRRRAGGEVGARRRPWASLGRAGGLRRHRRGR